MVPPPGKICLEQILTAEGWPLAVKYMDVFHNRTERSERSIVLRHNLIPFRKKRSTNKLQDYLMLCLTKEKLY